MTTIMVKVDLTSEQDKELWRDAYRMAWVGASNPLACAAALLKHSKRLMDELQDTRAVLQHPALQAMAGQLASLYGQSVGPSDKVYDVVEANAIALGLLDANGALVG